MVKMNPKNLMISAFLGVLIVEVLLTSGCIQAETNTTKPETQIPIIENINTEEVNALIQENNDNPNFVILDVRTPEEYLSGHIENAVNLDYYSNTFGNNLDELDKNKTYLIYCRSGRCSENTLNIMKELDFREAYNCWVGLTNGNRKDFQLQNRVI